MKETLLVVGGFVGGIVFTALFARRLMNMMSSELQAIASKLHRS